MPKEQLEQLIRQNATPKAWDEIVDQLPHEKRTNAFCLRAVKNHPYAIRKLSTEERTYKVCLAAVTNAIAGLDWQLCGPMFYVPIEHQNEQLCLEAVLQRGEALGCVRNEEHRSSPKVCMAAVRQSGKALQYVPFPLRNDPDICEAAVNDNPFALEYVPEGTQLPEAVYRSAVQINSVVLRFVPEDRRTHDVCVAALEFDFLQFEYVPVGVQTSAMCLDAVIDNGMVLSLVRGDLLRSEMYTAAVRSCWRALQNVPENERTDALCLCAVQQSAFAIEYVPEMHMTVDVCIAAIMGKMGRMGEWLFHRLQKSPAAMRHDVCQLWVDRLFDPRAWTDSDRVFFSSSDGKGISQTEEMCVAAVACQGRLLSMVRLNLRTKEVCSTAVEQNPCAIHDVPPNHRTVDLCIAAMQKKGPITPIPEHWSPHWSLSDECRLKAFPEVPFGMALRSGVSWSDIIALSRCLAVCKDCATNNANVLAVVVCNVLSPEFMEQYVRRIHTSKKKVDAEARSKLKRKNDDDMKASPKKPRDRIC